MEHTFFNENTNKQDFYEYSTPEDTPALMAQWLKEFNQRNSAKHSR